MKQKPDLRPAKAHRIRGTCPPRLVPSPVSRCILPEIIHAESQRKGLRHDPAVRLG